MVVIAPDGTETPYAHYLPVDGHSVRAVSEPGLYPQGYIGEVQAADACVASGKRLCSYPEWKTACMGPKKTAFPYGEARRSGVCNDAAKSAVVAVFGAKAVASSPVSALIAAANDPSRRKGGVKAKASSTPAAKSPTTTAAAKKKTASTKSKDRSNKKRGGGKKKDKAGSKAVAARPAPPSKMPAGLEFNVWTQLNDPRLGQVDGTLAKTGEHPDCANGFGVFDMVGNIHEWVATDPTAAHGTFAGGYYLDTSLNGDGCGYRTQAHAHDYHDYSTGFRCCADPKE
jgi:formylglycine-generating enzyme required for sulfatase activity